MRLILLALLFALPAQAEVPQVVTDIAPVHSLVAQVMGDLGAPDLLLDTGADAHSFQLRPSQARALAKADLIIRIGPELTPWLDHAIDGIGAKGAQLHLLDVAGTSLLQFDDADHAEGHDHGPIDPHAWLNPDNAGVWLGIIAAELAKADPDNAASYAANATAARTAIAALDADLAARLAPVKTRRFVTYHDAYGYLVAHYGLTKGDALSDGDAAEPGAAQVTMLRDMLKAGDVACLFPEQGHSPGILQQIAADTGLKLAKPLDPMGAKLAPGPDLYAAMMRGLADTLTDCLADQLSTPDRAAP